MAIKDSIVITFINLCTSGLFLPFSYHDLCYFLFEHQSLILWGIWKEILVYKGVIFMHVTYYIVQSCKHEADSGCLPSVLPTLYIEIGPHLKPELADWAILAASLL